LKAFETMCIVISSCLEDVLAAVLESLGLLGLLCVSDVGAGARGDARSGATQLLGAGSLATIAIIRARAAAGGVVTFGH